MAEQKQTLLTPDGKQDLEATLPTLIARKREIKERLQSTKTYGDAADGGEGSEAKNELHPARPENRRDRAHAADGQAGRYFRARWHCTDR